MIVRNFLTLCKLFVLRIFICYAEITWINNCLRVDLVWFGLVLWDINLWHSTFLCICRLTLTRILREISTKLEECWLILTGLPSLMLESLSCRLVSSLSSVDSNCHSASPVTNCFRWVSSPNSRLAFPSYFRSHPRSRVQTLCLVSSQNRQRNRLLGEPPYIVSQTIVGQLLRNLFIHILNRWFLNNL